MEISEIYPNSTLLEFSHENFLSLGRGIYKFGKLLEKLFETYDTLIIPSRGACPLLYPALEICNYIAYQTRGELKLSNIGMTSLLKKYKKYTKFKPLSQTSEEDKKVILAPLTADVSVDLELMDSKNIDNKEELQEEFTEKIRSYGARLINSFYMPPEERIKDPYFRFFDFILREVEGRSALASEYENFPPIKKGIIVDTAISGRAFTTVMRHLIQLGKQPFSILFIDRFGQKLKKENKGLLRKWEYSGNLVSIEVSRILSEDRGAGLLGVSGVIYPQLMTKFEDYLSPIGAVTWHSSNIRRYREVFSSYQNALVEAAKVAWAEEEAPERIKGYNKCLEKKIANFIKNLEKFDVLKVPDIVNGWTKYPYKKITESSAHVIHIYFSERDLEKLLRKYITNYYQR